MHAAETRHFWFVGTRNVIVDVLSRALGTALEGARVLDVGCGTGYTLSRLPAGVRATGIDISSTSVALARERAPSATIVQGSAGALPFEDGSFDACIALDVLEHLDDDLGAARELARVVRPGGVVLITVPALKILWHAHDEALHHRRRYTLAEIVSVVERAELLVEKQSYYNFLLFPLVFGQRVGSRLLGLSDSGDSDLSIPPAPLNRVLGAILSSERYLLEHLRLPIGVSCLVVARAPHATGPQNGATPSRGGRSVRAERE